MITGHYQNPGLVFTDYMGFAMFNENLLNDNVPIKSKSGSLNMKIEGIRITGSFDEEI